MMAGLLKYQTPDGMWRQLIDRQESWEESSSTGMFTFALISGVKNGWLDAATYGPAARKAWIALTGFIDQNSDITSVCEGTGKRTASTITSRAIVAPATSTARNQSSGPPPRCSVSGAADLALQECRFLRPRANPRDASHSMKQGTDEGGRGESSCGLLATGSGGSTVNRREFAQLLPAT